MPVIMWVPERLGPSSGWQTWEREVPVWGKVRACIPPKEPRSGRIDSVMSDRTLSRRSFLGGAAAAVALAACGKASASRASPVTLRVAIVSNSQMDDAISLSPVFEHQHPGIRLKFVNLPENEARAKITADVATQGGEFDVVMISNYETPLWAKNGWIVDLQPYIDRTPGYDAADFVPRIRSSLSYNGHLYSVPFYGESSFVMYRKDLFDRAGVVMPTHPTWLDVVRLAKRFHDPRSGHYGIVLRGDPGWGENLAPIDTVINAFGGRWYNMRWEAQLTTPQVKSAVGTYIETLRAARWWGRTATPGRPPRPVSPPGGSTPGPYPCRPPAPTGNRHGSSWPG